MMFENVFKFETFGVTQNYKDDFHFGSTKSFKRCDTALQAAFLRNFILIFGGEGSASNHHNSEVFFTSKTFFFCSANSMMLFRSTQTEKKKRHGVECAEAACSRISVENEFCCGNKSLWRPSAMLLMGQARKLFFQALNLKSTPKKSNQAVRRAFT